MFKPGQEVVCIKSHSQRIVIKDNTYTVLGIINCSCGRSAIDVGVKDDYPFIISYCECGIGIKVTNNIWWVGSSLFASPEDWQQAETMVEVLKEDLELVEVCKKSL